MQDDLYKLRAETQESFDEAKALLARQKELDREQRELHQVRPIACRGPTIIIITI